jgi:exopolysaccharide production protein ExoQ
MAISDYLAGLTSPADNLAVPPRQNLLIGATALLIILCLLGPFMSYSDLPGAGEGSPARQLGYALVALLAFVGIRPIAAPKRILVIPVFIVIALAWCWLSVIWALSPSIAVRRIVLTMMIIWSIFAIVKYAGYQQPVQIIRILLAALLAINLATSILFPDFGIHHVNEPGDKGLIGDWRGIMTHKNFAGPPTVLAILFFVFDAKKIPLVLRATVIAAACYFLVYCQSKTSVGIGIFALIVGIVFTQFRNKYRPLIIILFALAGAAAGVMAFVYQDPLSGNFTDERSFTGRPLIWKALYDYWVVHPWLGSGFGSFWNIGPGGPIYKYATGWVTQITVGHNGFLDLLVQIGIPGLALVVFATVVVPLYRLLSNPEDFAQRSALIISVLVFCIGHNSTETTLFDRDAIGQVFLMFSIAFIGVLKTPSKRSSLGLTTRAVT